MIEHKFIRIAEEGNDADLDITFEDSNLPILQYQPGQGWRLYYLNAHDEVEDYLVGGQHRFPLEAADMARGHLDGDNSSVFPTTDEGL